MKVDLHLHTIYSDGIETPEKIVRRAKEVGLDGIAITDHDSINGWRRALAEGKRIGLSVITGKEIKIKENNRAIGEILALFIDADVKGGELRDIGDTVDAVRSQDGIVTIAHPFDPWIKFSKNPMDAAIHFFDPWRKSKLLDAIEKMGIKLDAIEVLNGRNGKGANNKSEEYARKSKLAKIAGSDAHWIYEVGSFYTIANATNLDEFRRAIKKRSTEVGGSQKNFFEIAGHRIATNFGKIMISRFRDNPP